MAIELRLVIHGHNRRHQCSRDKHTFIDSTSPRAPHQFDMKDPKVLRRLKTLRNNRPRYQQAMAKAWSRTASDFNIKSTTQLNAQVAIKWINEFENIRRKEPGLIK